MSSEDRSTLRFPCLTVHLDVRPGTAWRRHEMASTRTEERVQIDPGELVNSVVDEAAGLAVRRLFTIAGRDPFDEIEWETRDAHIPGKNGPAFEQRGVEFPKFWSQTATNIVAQKYFRGRMS